MTSHWTWCYLTWCIIALGCCLCVLLCLDWGFSGFHKVIEGMYVHSKKRRKIIASANEHTYLDDICMWIIWFTWTCYLVLGVHNIEGGSSFSCILFFDNNTMVPFSGLALGCWIIISIFKIHFVEKKDNLWNLCIKYTKSSFLASYLESKLRTSNKMRCLITFFIASFCKIFNSPNYT